MIQFSNDQGPYQLRALAQSGDQDQKNLMAPELVTYDLILIDIIWGRKHKKSQ